ncbi:MAG: alpha/beta fold hydrolase, partial [Pseudonocardiaceae bacterium]
VRARFDIVGFDPRGVGGSAQLRCFTDAREQAEFWGDLPAWPLTRDQEQPYLRRTAEYTELCGRRHGERLDHLSTVDVARDLDRLRAAVGDEKLTYVGYSYGSYLGEVYANLFPQRVRALALDGVIDPETWADQSPRELTEAAYGGEQALDAVTACCAGAGDACAFAAGDTAAEVRQRLDAVLERIERAPLPAPNADPPGELDYHLANGAYLISMYDTFFWPILAAGLAQAEAGDGSLLLDFIRHFIAPPDVYSNGQEVWSAVFCTDGTFPRDARVWPTLVRLSELVAPTFSRYWWYTTLSCATWPGHAPDRYAGPWDRPTAAPILMVNTLADPATPYAGAVRAQRRMADARL